MRNHLGIHLSFINKLFSHRELFKMALRGTQVLLFLLLLFYPAAFWRMLKTNDPDYLSTLDYILYYVYDPLSVLRISEMIFLILSF